MMRPTLCVIGVVIWYFVTEANCTKKALIFNPKKNSIISLPNNLSNVNCDNWMTVCPAKDDDERDFNSKYSTYDKALFLQNIYNSNAECANLDEAKCDEPFEISFAYNAKRKTYEIGYEAFHQSAKLSNISPLRFGQVYPLKKYKKPASSLDLAGKMITNMNEVLKRGLVELRLRGDSMEFLWIPLVKIKLNVLYLRSIEYEIRKNNISPMLECQDYSFGKELVNSAEADSLYSNESQMKVFENVKLPTRTSSTDELPEGACTPEYECLKKWPLLPTDQFRFGSDSPLNCSNLTTIPIWKSTLEGIMGKLDQYLYVLRRISGQPLRVLATVRGLLKLPSKKKLFFNQSIILKEENWEIKTPQIIYKMVTFKSNPCEKSINCWYGILIVIHNGPYRPISKKDLVCEDKSGDFGWEEITYETWSNEGAQSKFIYVCEISKETMQNVGLAYTKDTKFEPLSLLKFPLLNKDKQLTFRSIKGDVFKELKRLSEPGQVVELNDSLIERPSINYNFGSEDGDGVVYEEDEEESGGSSKEANKKVKGSEEM